MNLQDAIKRKKFSGGLPWQHVLSLFSFDSFLSALAEKFADIFFLVDSGLTPQEFQQIRGVLNRVVNQVKIGASAYRLGLAQYGQDVKVEFLLNAFQTKEETQNGIKRFRHRRLQANEPRNLGNALQYANTHFFTSEAGSREDLGYRQYLVVLSGKDSDDADVVQKASRLIKSSGVTVVGMSLGASMNEMRVVGTAPYIYQFTQVSAVQILKGIFEKEEVEITLTGGEWMEVYHECTFENVFLYFLYIIKYYYY